MMSKVGKLLISILALAFILAPPPAQAASSVSFVDQGVWVVDGERFFPLVLYWGPGPQNEEATWVKMKLQVRKASKLEMGVITIVRGQCNRIFPPHLFSATIPSMAIGRR